MPIHFTEERWARIEDDYTAWWSGELKRPIIHVTLHGFEPDRNGPPVEHPPPRTAGYYVDGEADADRIVDQWDYQLSGQRWLGDGFPSVCPDFGPGIIAGCMGCKVEIEPSTVWFSPPRDAEITDITLRYDPNHVWSRRLESVMGSAIRRWDRDVVVGMTDLGGNMDIVASFRHTDDLLMDLYDEPEAVERVLAEAHEGWWAAFEQLNDTLFPANRGYSAWTPMFSRDPYYMLQCDFAYMISPDMFDRFIKPELEATCRRLANPFYHLDGPGQLPHLDRLLAIPELKGIQWVPGDGQPDITHWPEVYRRVRAAGKRIQFFSGQSSEHGHHALDIIADQLGSAEGICMIHHVGKDQIDDVSELLTRHGCPTDL